MGRKPLSVRPTKMYLFMSVIGNMNAFTKRTGKGVSESLRMAMEFYMQKGPKNDKNTKSTS